MTILPMHRRGLASIAVALHDGEAVVIPFPVVDEPLREIVGFAGAPKDGR